MKLFARSFLCVALSLACTTYPLAQQQQTQPATTTPLLSSQSDTNAQPAPPALSNKDVIEMLKAGLTPEIVIAKIKTSVARFDTSPDALQELKKAGVPDAVILSMVQAPVGSVAPAAYKTVTVAIPDGTVVEVDLSETISSDHLKVGDLINFYVVHPVLINGVTVIERDAGARGRIVRSKKAGYWGRSGKLEWTMQDVVAVDGSRIPLRFTGGQKGTGATGKVATGILVTGILFFPAAPLWGFKKGKNAVITARQRYSVAVHGSVNVKGKAATPQAQ